MSTAIATAVATVARAAASIPRDQVVALEAAAQADPSVLLAAGMEVDAELRVIRAVLELGDAVRAADT